MVGSSKFLLPPPEHLCVSSPISISLQLTRLDHAAHPFFGLYPDVATQPLICVSPESFTDMRNLLRNISSNVLILGNLSVTRPGYILHVASLSTANEVSLYLDAQFHSM